MFSDTDFNSTIESAKAQLRATAEALSNLATPEIKFRSIKLTDLSNERIEELLKDIPTGYAKKDKETDFVYIIQASGPNGSKIFALKSTLEKSRKTANDYSRVNQDHDNTNTIYVGRSKTIRARLRQHLGAESQGIFSLHLQRWAKNIDMEITIYLMSFIKSDDLLVQTIEDGLWNALKPAFGRKGER